MSHEIATVTTCNLCQQKFIGPQALLVGGAQQRNGRVVHLMHKLTEHLMKEHPQVNGLRETQALEYLGMLRLLEFTARDQELLRQIDYLRWRVRQATTLVRIPDEKIETKCKGLSRSIVDLFFAVLTPPDAGPGLQLLHDRLREKLESQVSAMLIPIVAAIRDALEEPNRFPADPLVIQPGQTTITP